MREASLVRDPASFVGGADLLTGDDRVGTRLIDARVAGLIDLVSDF